MARKDAIVVSKMTITDEYYRRFKDRRIKKMLKVKSEIRRAMADFLNGKGFLEISPVIISLETDPLCHTTFKTDFEYYGGRYQLTQSMILHKMIAALCHDKIFAFSPNIRLEEKELVDTGKHLIEFTQLDLEVSHASREDLLKLGEELITHVISVIKKNCEGELKFFDRNLKVPQIPFKRIKYKDAYNKYGKTFENVLSKENEEPFWLIDIPVERREFYDKENPNIPGILLDMDLIYPEGYGEGLSGGEREHKEERIIERIKKQGLAIKDFKLFLEFAKRGLPPCGGFGIGLERLTRFICGLDSVEEATLFPKPPGTLNL